MIRSRTPPRLGSILVGWLAPPALREQIVGDLAEGFARERSRRGPLRAYQWYWREVLFFRPVRLRRALRSSTTRGPYQRREMFFQRITGDVRLALRAVRKSPAFASVVVGTLAVGIGANTAIFSIVNIVLLRPLPYPDAERLVMVFRTVPRFGFPRSTSSYPDFADWREQANSFTSLAAYASASRVYLGSEGALALIGVYGVLAYAVGDRSREIGIRMALGARHAQVLSMVLGRGMLLTGIGVALGVGGALALTGFLEGMLFGLAPRDPATLVGVAVAVSAIAALACYFPARRAARLDPAESLRYE